MKPRTPLYGLMAEFKSPEEILAATRRTRGEGFTHFDAFTPYPVEGLGIELGLKNTGIPFVVLMAALVGAVVGFAMQYYSMAVDYPLNSGGRPYNSWPAFIPIAFEVMVLVAGLATLLGMLLLNGLPRPYHPVFNVPRFLAASRDRFFLCIEAVDPKYGAESTRQFLAGLAPAEVMEVAALEPAPKASWDWHENLSDKMVDRPLAGPSPGVARRHGFSCLPAANGQTAELSAGRTERIFSGWQIGPAAGSGRRRARAFADGHAFIYGCPPTSRRLACRHGVAHPRGGAGLEPRTAKNPLDLGTEENNAVDSFPFPVTEKVLKHGQNRYLIYCVVCHDALGTGHGIIVQRGYTPPPSFHRERLRKVPVGHIFEVITKGYGSMPMYRAQIPPRDRWAIVAYVRALQLSQHFPVEDLPADLRRQWEAQKAGGGGE